MVLRDYFIRMRNFPLFLLLLEMAKVCYCHLLERSPKQDN